MSKSLCCLKIFPQRFENNDGNGDSSFMFVLYARGCVAKITKIPQRDHMLWRFHYNQPMILLRSPLEQNYSITVKAP